MCCVARVTVTWKAHLVAVHVGIVSQLLPWQLVSYNCKNLMCVLKTTPDHSYEHIIALHNEAVRWSRFASETNAGHQLASHCEYSTTA